jgi:hypothetical protein
MGFKSSYYRRKAIFIKKRPVLQGRTQLKIGLWFVVYGLWFKVWNSAPPGSVKA